MHFHCPTKFSKRPIDILVHQPPSPHMWESCIRQVSRKTLNRVVLMLMSDTQVWFQKILKELNWGPPRGILHVSRLPLRLLHSTPFTADPSTSIKLITSQAWHLTRLLRDKRFHQINIALFRALNLLPTFSETLGLPNYYPRLLQSRESLQKIPKQAVLYSNTSTASTLSELCSSVLPLPALPLILWVLVAANYFVETLTCNIFGYNAASSLTSQPILASFVPHTLEHLKAW